MDYLEILTGGVAVFPMVAQLTALDIHFKIKSFELKSIYNFFATLFGLSVYLIIKYLEPNKILDLWEWHVFMILSFVLVLVYVIILIYKRAEVNSNQIKWPIITNFVIYISIFLSLTAGFGVLNVYKDNYIFKGEISKSGMQDLSDVKINIYDHDEAKNNLTVIPDRDGNFHFTIPKNSYAIYDELSILGSKIKPEDIPIKDPFSLQRSIESIELKKQETITTELLNTNEEPTNLEE